MKDGGPAFPQNIPHDQKYLYPGMSLRDWLAGQALAIDSIGRAYHNRPDVIARLAYEVADAMLAERDKRAVNEEGSDG